MVGVGSEDPSNVLGGISWKIPLVGTSRLAMWQGGHTQLWRSLLAALLPAFVAFVRAGPGLSPGDGEIFLGGPILKRKQPRHPTHAFPGHSPACPSSQSLTCGDTPGPEGQVGQFPEQGREGDLTWSWKWVA